MENQTCISTTISRRNSTNLNNLIFILMNTKVNMVCILIIFFQIILRVYDLIHNISNGSTLFLIIIISRNLKRLISVQNRNHNYTLSILRQTKIRSIKKLIRIGITKFLQSLTPTSKLRLITLTQQTLYIFKHQILRTLFLNDTINTPNQRTCST